MVGTVVRPISPILLINDEQFVNHKSKMVEILDVVVRWSKASTISFGVVLTAK
jgi:hypothetical protein